MIIAKPTDPRVLEALELKLQEYRSRMRMWEPADFRFFARPDDFTKERVLSRLLEAGEEGLDTEVLSLELDKEGHFDLQAFENACAVIHDYATTGGAHVSGGTGFPRPQVP